MDMGGYGIKYAHYIALTQRFYAHRPSLRSDDDDQEDSEPGYSIHPKEEEDPLSDCPPSCTATSCPSILRPCRPNSGELP